MTTTKAATPALDGLSEAEARRRLTEDGPNELPRSASRGFLHIALSVLREPMILLLLAAGTLYLLLGDRAEAILLLASISLIITIDLYQERRTENALEALRDLASPRALVIRDGQQRRIPGREVVRDDVIVVSEGDRVAADAEIISCTNLQTDEALLTGESVPVRKIAWAPGAEAPRPGGDDLPWVFSGTVATSGQGIARVIAIGSETEIGRIGTALLTLQTERTRLERETSRIVRILAVTALAFCVLVAAGTTYTRGSLVDGLLAGITVAMSLIPEEFPVVLTVFLALGAWRIARSNVLTRHIPAIEALGSVTVLCVDKTGTLTENRMSVARLATVSEDCTVDDALLMQPTPLTPLATLAHLAALASHIDPFDPMERAIKELDAQLSADADPRGPGELVRAYPLSDRLLVMAHAWRTPDVPELLVTAKGAPEDVFGLCALDGAMREEMTERVSAMASSGLRVLGVASARHAADRPLPDDVADLVWSFAGLVGLADPVRANVPGAVAESHEAGIRVVMLTGDYPVTARSIASQAGVTPLNPVVTGTDLETLDDGTLQELVRHAGIFARVRPEQKLRLIRALQSAGEVVAMTGDGVNDAPALKAADIGIAMGMRGTDVAREAADIVLADDDFTSIVRAVRLGRRIFDNLRRAMAFLLAVHVPIAGLALLPLVFGWPLILFPAHIVFLELVIDPACSIAFESEPEEPDVMRRPPRSTLEPLFDARTVIVSLVQGTGVMIVTASVLALALSRSIPDDEARTLAFCTLVVANLGLILANRAGTGSVITSLRFRNPALWTVVGGAVLLLAVVLTVPALRELFQFTPLGTGDFLTIAGASVVALVWLDVVRIAGRRLPVRGETAGAPRTPG